MNQDYRELITKELGDRSLTIEGFDDWLALKPLCHSRDGIIFNMYNDDLIIDEQKIKKLGAFIDKYQRYEDRRKEYPNLPNNYPFKPNTRHKTTLELTSMGPCTNYGFNAHGQTIFRSEEGLFLIYRSNVKEGGVVSISSFGVQKLDASLGVKCTRLNHVRYKGN